MEDATCAAHGYNYRDGLPGVVQETERMNVLLARIRSTLSELDLGLKGDLTVSEPMERLMQARSCSPISLSSVPNRA